MQPMRLLSTLRALSSVTLDDCKRGEYKSTVIVKAHNDKLRNLAKAIEQDNLTNRKVKSKLLTEVNKLYITAKSSSHYGLIEKELKSKLNTLTSAIDFMKR